MPIREKIIQTTICHLHFQRNCYWRRSGSFQRIVWIARFRMVDLRKSREKKKMCRANASHACSCSVCSPDGIVQLCTASVRWLRGRWMERSWSQSATHTHTRAYHSTPLAANQTYVRMLTATACNAAVAFVCYFIQSKRFVLAAVAFCHYFI